MVNDGKKRPDRDLGASKGLPPPDEVVNLVILLKTHPN